ncbi:hypothetical protein PMIN01_00997 [Paraphaeosphaeria minitans]|uniref:Uncharacterized protein n=1 Tax=Paraphaeosphaeria minitans TaxID=565426 RepID=A0A9P6KVZ6_9PLEO|nr:hypothetical protein PMIN01_00997 [Paraphaeosphaeria minitans]
MLPASLPSGASSRASLRAWKTATVSFRRRGKEL